MRRLLDTVMRALARVLVHIFFRRVEVEGGARLSREGPLVVVANHTNGLVDGLLLMSSLGRFPRFLGKSTLFRIAPLWPFLKLAGVIPVYRAADGSTERNRSAFAQSNRLLADGGVVAIFPEGVSHDESSVQPLRTGAARIALEAEANDRVAELAIVAVGLIYDDKPRFRSRALVRVGVPVPVSAWRARANEDRTGAVRHLTDSLARQLDAVSPPYATWTQADELAQIAEVVARRPGEGTFADVGLARRADVAERLATLDGQPGCAGALHALRVAYADYRRDLDLIGLDDVQVASRPTPGALHWIVTRSFLKVVLSLPLALFGVAVHVIPFQIVKRVAQIPANEGMRATVKLLGCFFLFVLTYAAIGVAVGLQFGAGFGAAIAVLAPLGGYVALRLFERMRRIGGILAGRRAWRNRRTLLDSVIEHRSDVVSEAQVVLTSP